MRIANRLVLALFLALFLAAPRAAGVELPFDLPIDLRFNLGFGFRVAPGPGDASRALCLVVSTDKIVTDKRSSLVVTGTIANYSGVFCEGVSMRFAVTSHVGIGKSLGTATVTPSSIPPGGTAVFSLHMSLDSRYPKLAQYTVTAASPPLCGTN